MAACVTFTNTTCDSDDRLKFNEKNITNSLDTVMKLSPEIYDKIEVPNIENNNNKKEVLTKKNGCRC